AVELDPRAALQPADLRDLAAGDSDVSREARRARAVDDGGAANDEVEVLAHLLPGIIVPPAGAALCSFALLGLAVVLVGRALGLDLADEGLLVLRRRL